MTVELLCKTKNPEKNKKRIFKKSEIVSFAQMELTQEWVVLLKQKRKPFGSIKTEWVTLVGDFEYIKEQMRKKLY